MEFLNGFYPALGTPLDNDGNLVEESYLKQIELMLDAKARGVLCMGSMGTEQALTTKTYRKTAEVASKAVNKRVPLLIGAMDNSVFRVKERIDALKGIDYDGLVLTTPFYQMDSFKDLVNYFTEIADYSDKPVYLYDLPGVTKQKITFPLLKELAKHENIKGVKSGDIVLGRLVKLNLPNFNFFFSNLDIFDVSISYGIEKVLDGMFTCMPKTSKALTLAIEKGDKEEITKNVSTIIAFRDQFLKNGIWPGYTIAMNLLGLKGNYGVGYKKHEPLATEYEEVKAFLKQAGEI
ncbi:MAG: dihydrodipicolinate synthase family protein [Clostridia bacterium]|nr:dihydrodipicolinate synthase family protein [Clostridia bacterium]